MNYYIIPQVRVRFGGSAEATGGLISAAIELAENTYWKADCTFINIPPVYPTFADVDTEIVIEAQDGAVGGNWGTLFSGKVLSPDTAFSSAGSIVKFLCVGQGYALNMMNIAEEYGVQSRNPTCDSIQSILTDASVGIIPKWVNKYAGGTFGYDSGYSIDTTNVEDLTGSIQFISFPWKPADKSLNDLCDLHTAIAHSTSQAGPHYIVDHDGYLRLKRIGATQTGWTKYYGDSQTAATLTQGVDFIEGDYQTVKKEANVILYIGTWRRPSNGDSWTEAASGSWGHNGFTTCSDSTTHVIGAKSLYCDISGGDNEIWWPSDKAADWNFSIFDRNVDQPVFNFHFKAGNLSVALIDDAGLAATYVCTLLGADWTYINLPIGPYYKEIKTNNAWTSIDTGFNWACIKYITFWGTSTAYIDGLHFTGAHIIRIARQEFPDEVAAGRGTLGTAANPVKFKVITDNVAKDDTLASGTPDTTDTGLMAQLAKAELLRSNKTTIVGKFSTPLIADILPGQYVYIDGVDWRITKVTHKIPELKTYFEVTDDLTNTHPRLRYEDVNKIYAAIRPEWQDRQASSIKAGNVDIRILPLEEKYNI